MSLTKTEEAQKAKQELIAEITLKADTRIDEVLAEKGYLSEKAFNEKHDALVAEKAKLETELVEVQKVLNEQSEQIAQKGKLSEADSFVESASSQFEEMGIAQKGDKNGAIDFNKFQNNKAEIAVKANTLISGWSTPMLTTYKDPKVAHPGNEEFSVRDIYQTITVPKGTEQHEFNREQSSSVFAAATKAEGAAFAESHTNLAGQTTQFQEIGTIFKVSKRAVNTVPKLQAYIKSRGMSDFKITENTQLLTGNNSGNNLNGGITASTAFATGASGSHGFYQRISSATNFDVLRACLSQLSVARRNPTAIVVNPVDYHLMQSIKDTQGRYIREFVDTFDGIPIKKCLQITAGSFFVLDKMSFVYNVSENMSIQMFDQDEDNVQRGLVTIRLMNFGGLSTYNADGGVHGTFSAAITDIQTP